MILSQATIYYKGYDPDDLKPKSTKRICCSCDGCGRVRWMAKQSYKNLCISCVNKQKFTLPKPKFVPESERFFNDTQIDRILTIKQFGYDPIDLSKKSSRKIIAICQNCSKIRKIKLYSYHKLCRTCAQQNKPPISEETRKKIIKNHAHLSGKDNGMFGRTGNKNPMWGRKHSDETRKLISDNHADVRSENNPMFGMSGEDSPVWEKFGELSPNWKGGLKLRTHVIPIKRCIQLNDKFYGSEGHHIMSGVVIFMPKDLHKSVWHDLKNGLRINEINDLAFNYLMGDF